MMPPSKNSSDEGILVPNPGPVNLNLHHHVLQDGEMAAEVVVDIPPVTLTERVNGADPPVQLPQPPNQPQQTETPVSVIPHPTPPQYSPSSGGGLYTAPIIDEMNSIFAEDSNVIEGNMDSNGLQSLHEWIITNSPNDENVLGFDLSQDSQDNQPVNPHQILGSQRSNNSGNTSNGSSSRYYSKEF